MVPSQEAKRVLGQRDTARLRLGRRVRVQQLVDVRPLDAAQEGLEHEAGRVDRGGPLRGRTMGPREREIVVVAGLGRDQRLVPGDDGADQPLVGHVGQRWSTARVRMEVPPIEERRQVSEQGPSLAIHDARADHRQVRERTIALHARVELGLVGARVFDPLGISRDVRLVRSLHRVDGPADPVADDLQVPLKRGGALGQAAGADARRDAVRGQPPHAIELVLARAAEPVVDVTHAELAQPGPHSAEVAVGGVEPREADIDAHGVPERAGRGRRNERLVRVRGRGPRRRRGPGPDGDRHQHVQDRQDWEEPAVDRCKVLGIRAA